MESIARSINLKIFIFLMIGSSLINSFNSRVNGEIKNNNNVNLINEIDFETVLNQNSVKFYEYEKPEILFDDFFGLGNSMNESNFNTSYQDLSLQIDSKNVRELYKKKLLEMIKSPKKVKGDKVDWSFFNKKI